LGIEGLTSINWKWPSKLNLYSMDGINRILKDANINQKANANLENDLSLDLS